MRDMKFACLVRPEDAEFPGGDAAMIKFLREEAIDKLSISARAEINMASVSFTVDQRGKVSRAVIVEPTGNDETDDAIVNALKRMPTWTPSHDDEGNTFEQTFEFVFGTNFGCYSPHY